MSDHNKMLIDRIKGMPAQPGDLSEEIGWLLQEVDEQKAEIDRLRYEADRWKRVAENKWGIDDIAKYQEEIDRLHRRVAELERFAEVGRDENAELRKIAADMRNELYFMGKDVQQVDAILAKTAKEGE